MRRTQWRMVVALGTPVLLLFGNGVDAAGADVTQLKASAYGAYASVGLFGGPAVPKGPTPTVELPATGGNDSKNLPEFIAKYGPATILGGKYNNGYPPTGELKATVEGKTGADGFASSSASVKNVGPDVITADEVSSTCRATEAGVSGSTTIANGNVAKSFRNEEPAELQPTGNTPAPNTVLEGTITHVGDNYRVVLNEQKVENGVLTVNGAHMYLLGPNATGDLIVAQSVCGVPGVVASTAPPATEPATTTTVPVTQPATTLEAEPASESSDAGPAILIGVVVLVILGSGAYIFWRRRGRPPDSPTPT